MDPKAGLTVCEKFRPHRDSMAGPISPSQFAIPTELSQPTSISGTGQEVLFCLQRPHGDGDPTSLLGTLFGVKTQLVPRSKHTPCRL